MYRPGVFYGELNKILLCRIPSESFWGSLQGSEQLLALITPCQTYGKDAAKGAAEYKRSTAPIITDLKTVAAVVGRVYTRGYYGIIDRSNGLVDPTFTE